MNVQNLRFFLMLLMTLAVNNTNSAINRIASCPNLGRIQAAQPINTLLNYSRSTVKKPESRFMQFKHTAKEGAKGLAWNGLCAASASMLACIGVKTIEGAHAWLTYDPKKAAARDLALAKQALAETKNGIYIYNGRITELNNQLRGAPKAETGFIMDQIIKTEASLKNLNLRYIEIETHKNELEKKFLTLATDIKK